jgi:hypothetical protein
LKERQYSAIWRTIGWQDPCVADAMSAVTLSAPVGNPVVAGPTAANAQGSDRGFSFGDLLDIVNPLQHIPVVSTIYRAITGDQIKTFPKIAGDMLYGGVAGFFSSVADTIFEKITGKNVGDTVLAWVEGEFSKPAARISTRASRFVRQPRIAIRSTSRAQLRQPRFIESLFALIFGHGTPRQTERRPRSSGRLGQRRTPCRDRFGRNRRQGR